MINEPEILILSAAQTVYHAWGWQLMLISEHQLQTSMIPLSEFYTAIGSVLVASIAYWVARLGGHPLVDKFARWVRIDAIHLKRAEAQFQRWGIGLVLIGRIIPGIRTRVSIPTGLARMPVLTFFLVTFIGAYIWYILLISIGYLLGNEWTLITVYLKQSLPSLLAGSAFALALYAWFTRRQPGYAPVRWNDE